MAADKRKILEAARKHAQKGAKDKALKEFGKLLKLDPRDAKLRLEVGDTYRRWGQIDEAIDAYSAVAQQFMQEGFDARAVAVFKQIQNLQPDSFGSYEQLAELYQRMGLAAEAIGCLEAAAEGYRKAGEKQQALGLLRKMAAIDPSNTTSRIKVADLLHQEGMKQDALSEYDAALGELELQGDSEAAAKVFERILEIDPDRVETIVRYARNLIEQGSAQRAESFAKRALERDRSPEHFELLADVYRLQKRDDDLVALYRELAELYRERGDEERTREILQRFVPLDEIGSAEAPNGYIDEHEKLAADDALDELAIGDENTLLDEDLLADSNLLVSDDDSGFGMLGHSGELDDLETDSLATTSDANERTRLMPDEPPGAARPAKPALDLDADIGQLLAEASVYLRYGKRSQAIANLESILARDLEHRPALEKLGEAYAAGDQAPKAVEMWSRAARLAAAAGEAQSAEVLRTRIAALDREAAAALDLSVAIAAKQVDEDELSIPDGDALRSGDESLDAEDLPELDLAEVSVHGGNAQIDVEIDIDDASFAEQHANDDVAVQAERGATDSGSTDGAGLDEISVDDISIDDVSQPRGASDTGADAVDSDALTAAPAQATGASAAKIAEELEEANFYFEQEMFDEAKAVYSRIVELAPGHPLAMVRLGEIAARGAAGVAPAAGAPKIGAEVTEPDAEPADSRADDSIGEDLANWQDEPAAAGPQVAPASAREIASPLAPDTAPDLASDLASDLESDLASDLASDLGLSDSADLDPAAESHASASAAVPSSDERDAEQSDELDSEQGDEQDETGEIPRSSVEAQIAATPPAAVDRPEPATGSKSAEPTSVAGSDGPGFDLAAELSESFDRDAGSSMSGPERAKGRRSTADDGFASVFAEFKKGVSAALSEGDYQAHYDLGIAYREMGLLHDAINELRLAMGDPERRVGCLHLLGMCAQDIGEPEQAIGYLQQALASDGLGTDTVLAIKLDLGKAHEAGGSASAARAVYEEIRAVDPGFADVAARLAGLAKLEAASAHDDAAAVTDEYESFDEFMGDLDEPAPAEADAAAEQPDAPPETPTWESFDDVVAEAEGRGTADEPTDATEKTPKRRRKKISFV